MQQTCLDLSQSFYNHVGPGQIRVIGTWIKQDGQSNEACLVLLDNQRKPGAHPPFVILLGSIWRWLEESNDDDLEIAGKAVFAVMTLGRQPINQEMHYVLDNVRNAVDALITSDIWQHIGPTSVIGEATMTDLLTGQREQQEIKILH